MQPIDCEQLPVGSAERAWYLCEVAQFQIANGMLVTAMDSLRQSLTLGCKYRWIAISNKAGTSITDPLVFLTKLRSSTFLTADEFQYLRRLIERKEAVDIFDAEKIVDAVAKVVETPGRQR
jgi:hypothetical protein